MSSKAWFEKSFRRLLVDMHIPDWNEEFLRDFSPEKYAEMMELALVDTAEVYAGSCLGLCYWPTKVGFPHKQLHGRDFLGETIEACRRRGVKVQIYLNVWNRAAHDAHPEWRIIAHDGKGTVEHEQWRYGVCCINTGFGQYFLDLLDELNSRYECPGFWIDMIGNFCYHHCYCPSCQERFRGETGFAEIPRVADWNDPAWIAFNRSRRLWLDEFAEKIYATVKKRTPDRTVTLQTSSIMYGRDSGLGEGFLQSSDFLAGDFFGDRVEQSYICKFFSALSRNHPMEFMTPRCESLIHHTTERPYCNLLMRSYAAVANQASFTLIDGIDPRGTLDRRFYEHAHGVNASYARFEKYLDSASVPMRDIGIFHSPFSLINLDTTPAPIEKFEQDHSQPYTETRRNMISAFQEEHLLFSFVHGGDPEKLKTSPVIVLSDCSCLTDTECAVLKEYVRAGGKLYTSFRTSLYDPDRGLLPDFKLADLFGIHYTGKQTEPITYIAPVSENAVPGVTREYPLMLNSRQLLVRAATDAEVIGTLTLPISSAKEINHFGSAISNPPMRETEFPSLIRHKYGNGEVLYVAGNLEEIPFPLHQSIFNALLKQLRGTTLIETNAPGAVEVTLFDQPDRNRLVLSLLNLPLELPPLPVHGLTICLNLPGKYAVKALSLAPEDMAYPFECKGNSLEIRLDKLEEFALFTLQY